MPIPTLEEANLKQRVDPKPLEPRVDPTQLHQEWTPYDFSYYLSGKLEGIELIFLLDSGCTTNLVTESLWTGLAPIVRARTQVQEGRGS